MLTLCGENANDVAALLPALGNSVGRIVQHVLGTYYGGLCDSCERRLANEPGGAR